MKQCGSACARFPLDQAPLISGRIECKTVCSFAGRSKIQARSSNGKLGRGNGRVDGSPSPHSLSLSSARPFPFDRRAWIFDLPAEEETVLQSSGRSKKVQKYNGANVLS